MATRRQRGNLTAQRRQQATDQNRTALAERDRKAGVVPRSNSQAGDFTGRERERLAEEQAAEVAEAQKRVGLATQIDTVIEEEGVFDALSGEHTLSPEVQAKVDGIEIAYTPDDEDLDPFSETAPAPANLMQDYRDPEIAQAEKVRTPNPGWLHEEEDVEIVQSPTKRFRVNSDIEDMTYGRDMRTGELRVLNLVRGRWYTGPTDLYLHLDAKGLIYH